MFAAVQGWKNKLERERRQDAWKLSWLLSVHTKRPLTVDEILGQPLRVLAEQTELTEEQQLAEIERKWDSFADSTLDENWDVEVEPEP